VEWVETTGRTVDQAKDAALDQLGVDESDAEFVVLSEPRPGLFGRMRGEARVRARVRPTSPRPKRSRTRRQAQPERTTARRRPAAGGSRVVGASGSSTAVSVVERESPANADANGRVPPGETRETTESAQRSRSSRRKRGPRDGGARRRAAGSDAVERAKPEREADVEREKEAVVGEELSLEEQGEAAREFVQGLVELLNLDATTSVSLLDEETAQVAVVGSGLGVLIGPGGGTLAALQELARAVVQRKTGGRSERIIVDAAGYRAKRAAALQRFSKQIAEEVLASGSERALEPMSPPDRKVVHDTINEIDGVVTKSVGEEPRRYIIIAPERPTSEAVEA
jgi:spoIIIJ-associated protein